MANAEPKKPRKKIGRPRKTIDYGVLDGLCEIQATGEECAAVLGIDYDTLNNILKREKDCTFTEYFRQKRAPGKITLRRSQFKEAVKGNAAMLIWLGKNWLDQSDTVQVQSNVELTGFRVVEDDE